MSDLLKAVKLDPDDAATEVVLAAHSTSLTVRSTSPINPRVFVFTHLDTNNTHDYDHIIVAYVRGEPLIEMAAVNGTGNAARPWNYYLARIDKRCGTGGCTPADLLTDKYDTDWNGVALYAEPELRDTTVDCAHCHKSAGNAAFHGNDLLLLFPERNAPWTHWFSRATDPGQKYFADFERMLGGRTAYGPIPKAKIDATDPKKLWDVVYLTFSEPDQIRNYSPREGKSAWTPMWAEYAAGTLHAPPHYDPVITDAALTNAAADVLARHAKGEIADKDVTDVRDIFARDKLVELGHVVDAQSAANQTLAFACMQCHDGTAPKGLSRAVFNAKDSASWTPQVKALVRARLALQPSDPKHMPPVRYSTLTDAAKQQLLQTFAE